MYDSLTAFIIVSIAFFIAFAIHSYRQVNGLRQKNVELRLQINYLTREIDNLQTQTTNLKQVNRELQKTISDVELQKDTNRRQANALEERYLELNKQIRAMPGNLAINEDGTITTIKEWQKSRRG